MKTGGKAVWVLACAAGFAAATPVAWADGCDTKDEREAGARMERAEGLERDGKPREAFNVVSRVDTMCVDQKRFDTILHRLGKTLGGQEERQGRLSEAFAWYDRAGLTADADRVMLARLRAAPGDRAVFGPAYGYFERREDAAAMKELRAIAAKNADAAFAEEERVFAARSESFDALDRAGDWLRYLGDDSTKRKTGRAEARGDALAAGEGLIRLQHAVRYYEIADRPDKVGQVRAKAMRLGDAYAQRGETTSAANFYRLAGADDKATELERRTEQAQQKKEGQRQEQFKKDQDDLEKALGF
ncbi:MAG: hypothetical protein IT489_01395 [Gammaproteobacteria bacterium]|nr:hypothetical protein [Gammaproteobacteria bacterium]